MERAAAAALLVLAGASVAHAGPWSEPDPAAIVGKWSGKATWKACAADGPGAVLVPVARDGGGYRIDLAAVQDGLGQELLAPIGARTLEATHDDLHVTWQTGKPGKAKVTLRFASGCEGTLALTRTSTGVMVCDELLALRAISTTCEVATTPEIPDDELATVESLAGGREAGRLRRAGVAGLCRRHATPLRASLVTAGCLPSPVAASGDSAKVPECAELVDAVGRLMQCQRVPVAMKQRLRISMAQVDRWAAVDRDDAESWARAAQTCADTRDELNDMLGFLGCAP